MATTTLNKPLTDLNLEFLPGEDELPCDDDTPLETERHLFQIFLLIETLQPWLQKSGKGYVGGNMFLYFSPRQIKREKVRGPDFFVVTNADPRERKSWVVWKEGLVPNVVIELLSDTTKIEDKTKKKTIYEKEVCVSEYFWYDPFKPRDWIGFELIQDSYQEKMLDIRGRYISKELGLALVKWDGVYLNRETTWLRFETLDGLLLPTKQERETEARQRETEARQREVEANQKVIEVQKIALQEKQRADAMAVKLRSMGIDPDNL